MSFSANLDVSQIGGLAVGEDDVCDSSILFINYRVTSIAIPVVHFAQRIPHLPPIDTEIPINLYLSTLCVIHINKHDSKQLTPGVSLTT